METNETKNDRNRKYYERNKEKIKEIRDSKKEYKSKYNKEYHEKNADTLKKHSKEYYLNNIEIAKKKSIDYYYENKEHYVIKHKEYREANIESVKIRQKSWYDNNKDKIRNNKYFKKYGITLEKYNEMLEIQGNKCKICGIHEDDLTYKLVIDHCHITNRVRGLLCSNCNTLLGFVKEEINTLNNAIEYLKNT